LIFDRLISKVYLALDFFDELEPYFMCQIKSSQARGRDLGFWKHPVKHYAPLMDRQMGPGGQCFVSDKVLDLCRRQLFEFDVFFASPCVKLRQLNLKNSLYMGCTNADYATD
jgi:hypothetical protein